LQVADDGHEKRKCAQDRYSEPEIKHVVLRPYVPEARTNIESRAEGKSRVAKETGEFGQADVVAIAQETLEKFGVGPVAHKKNRAREKDPEG
jgi:hypothetical protein